MIYDYLIVGAGLSGATFAQQAVRAGKTCLVIDSRNHIAGNCYTEKQHNIDVHMYGPHLFHTNSKTIWEYVQQFAVFNGYRHRVMAQTAQKLVPLPISLHTMNTLFGITTPQHMYDYFKNVTIADNDDTSIEGWCLKNIGRPLYELLIRDYTIKQWNKDPKQLPASIVRRLPVHYTWNTQYFYDMYEGIPIDGYTELVRNMLNGADVELNVDYFKNKELRNRVKKVVYTGSCDALFNYSLGHLEYRSISLQHEIISTNDYQGVGQINNTTPAAPYTRTIEHKHFNPRPTDVTIISREYSSGTGEPYYPINTSLNNELAQKYIAMAKDEGYIVCGRLARYQYYDMDQAIAQALKTAKEELHGYY